MRWDSVQVTGAQGGNKDPRWGGDGTCRGSVCGVLDVPAAPFLTFTPWNQTVRLKVLALPLLTICP